ncbi:hypothetical protein C8R43DRAFT_1122937 [Mycena crocata]|nr:hypothetical protein C8R43DRAFT_1122937 [Mycena crocata]
MSCSHMSCTPGGDTFGVLHVPYKSVQSKEHQQQQSLGPITASDSLPVRSSLQLYMAHVDCYLILGCEISLDTDKLIKEHITT